MNFQKTLIRKNRIIIKPTNWIIDWFNCLKTWVGVTVRLLQSDRTQPHVRRAHVPHHNRFPQHCNCPHIISCLTISRKLLSYCCDCSMVCNFCVAWTRVAWSFSTQGIRWLNPVAVSLRRSCRFGGQWWRTGSGGSSGLSISLSFVGRWQRRGVSGRAVAWTASPRGSRSRSISPGNQFIAAVGGQWDRWRIGSRIGFASRCPKMCNSLMEIRW